MFGGRPAAPSTRARSLASAWNQAGIDGESFPADEAFGDAALQYSLEQSPQQIAVAETAMAILRERRVIGHLAVEPEPTKME